MEEVTTKELRDYLLKYLKEERGLSARSINYYNSIIRFIYDVVLDYPINHKQLPMYKKKRKLPKILSEEELNVFFDACENYEYKTIFMLIYGSGLRISEETNLRIEDVDLHEYKTFEEARRVIFEFVESWYNRRRIHSAINYRTPEEIEKQTV